MIEFISSIILTLLVCKLMSSTSYGFIIFAVSFVFMLFLHILYENWLEVRLYRNKLKKIMLGIENINMQGLVDYKNKIDIIKSKLAAEVEIKGPFDINNPKTNIKAYINNDTEYQRKNMKRSARNNTKTPGRW